MRIVRTVPAFLLLAAGCAAAPEHGPVADEPADAPLCAVSLIAATTSLRPGTDTTVGVRFALRPPYHIYWRNPGDSGLAPTIDWMLPVGFTAAAPQWPAPVRHDAEGAVTFVYDGDVVLPVTLSIPAGAKGEAKLAARVTWLACSDAECIPGEAQVALSLPVSDAVPAPATESVLLLAEARARLPKPLAADAASVSVLADALSLVIDASEFAAALRADDLRTVAFFPDDPLALDTSAPPVVEDRRAAKPRILLTPYTRRSEPLDRLRGVLTVTTARRTLAYEIDAAVPRPPKEK